MHPLGRSVLRLGAVSLALGALGWGWELLARQAPSSSWHLAGYPDAIARFALHAWILGLAVFALAPRAFDTRTALGTRARLARGVTAALYVGAALTLGALGWSGATGRLGMQITESTGANHVALLARMAGEALIASALGIFTYFALRVEPAADP